MSEWQPIETAPKDGTVIDLWTRFGTRWADCFWHQGIGAWVSRWSEKGETGYIFRNGQPTHWMPLPDAPKDSSGSPQ